MKMTRNEAAEFLAAHDHYVILTHIRPDGDTIGSSAALCRGLRLLGKTAHVAENPQITPLYAGLHQGLTVPAAADTDTIVSVDVASPQMLPEGSRQYLGRIALRIDHHSTATSFTPDELVDPDSASCAEIIYDLLLRMGCPMDEKVAEAIYVGTSTDTGCFRYSNTTAHTFDTAAACMRAGVSVYRLNQELFETNSLARLRIQGWIVEHAKLLRGGRLCLCAIPLEVEQAIGVTEDDMDNISGFPRTIAGVCMAATLRQLADGTVKLSVRSIPGYDAAGLCARFGGGGHECSAGATIAMDFSGAAAAVEAAMLEANP